MQFTLHTPSCVSNKVTKHFLDYNKANFEAINNELAGFLDEYLHAFSERSLECSWNSFKYKIKFLITLFISCRNIVSNLLSSWFNVRLKCISNKKKHIFRAAKLSGLNERWGACKTAAFAYKVAIDKAQMFFFFYVSLSFMLSNIPKQF